jgi:hypothetical protein
MPIIGQTAATGIITPGGVVPTVTPVTFNSTWTDYGGGFNAAGYYKDQYNWVGLRGLVKNTVSENTDVFTLPVGFRPANTMCFAVHESNSLLTGTTWCRITSGGAVHIQHGPYRSDATYPNGSNRSAVSNYASLEGIYFPASGADGTSAGSFGQAAANAEAGAGVPTATGVTGSGALPAATFYGHPLGITLVSYFESPITGTVVDGTALFSEANTLSGRDVYMIPVNVVQSSGAICRAQQLRVDLQGDLAVVTNGLIPIDGAIAGSPNVPSAYGHTWWYDAARANTVIGTLAANAAFAATQLAVPVLTRVTPTFQNSWISVGSPYQDAWYQKVGNRVFLGGVVSGGADNSVVFTLPSGFHPAAGTLFAAAGITSGGPIVGCRVDVGSNGAVTATSGGGSGFLSFAGISFLADGS